MGIEKDQFNKWLINAIKEKLPSNILISSYISNILNVGREAAYRRIRGDVEFSFNEVMTIMDDLDISLDCLKNNKSEGILFTPYLIYDSPIENYNANLSKVTDDFQQILSDGGEPKVFYCYDSIPPELLFNYSHIMQLRWAKYIFQYDVNKPLMVDDIKIPICIQNTFDRFNEVVQQFDMTLIIGEHILQTTFEEIKYFAYLKLFSKDYLSKLEIEINQFIDELESYSLSGKNQINKRFDIYLYHVYSTGSLVLAEGAYRNIAYLKTYGTNYFSTENPVVCEAQKSWIKDMKKNSTYITQSGEIIRVKFFREQRLQLDKCVQAALPFLD